MKKLYFFAFFLVLYEFTTYISNDMIMPGMLEVVKEFHVSLDYVSASVTVYILGNCGLQLFLGPLSEHYGKRRIILIGNALFFVVTIFLMFVQDIQSFMIARFIQGSGMGFIAMGYAIIHENFDDKTAVKTFALMGNISILAPLLGPLCGVGMMHWGGWRSIFIVIAILAILSFIGLFKYAPETEKPKQHTSLLTNIKIYTDILKNKQFLLGTLSCSVSLLPLIIWIGLSPTLIMKTENLSMLDYGFYQIVAIGGLMISSIVMQFIAGKFSFSGLMTTMSIFSWLGLIITLIAPNSLNLIAAGLFIYSLGFGIFNNLVIRLVMKTQDLPQSLISSMMVFLQTLIMSLGMPLATYIASASHYSLSSFAYIDAVLGCLFLAITCYYAHLNCDKIWD